MKKFKLPRTKQCAKCPWRVSTNPLDIPDGYSVELHKNLSCTIANHGSLSPTASVMACHHSSGSDEMYCIGWLYNQLGAGNNIPLRIKMSSCENIRDMKTYGKQHKTFEETLP